VALPSARCSGANDAQQCTDRLRVARRRYDGRFIWAHRLQGVYWDGDPKVIVTILILAAYIGYTFLAQTAAWRGARASVLCILNFMFVIFSYSIVNRYLRTFTVTSDWCERED